MPTLFSRLDPHVQRISGWLTLGGAILSGLYAILAKTAPLFDDLNWAGAILVGITLALATMFALALLLVVVGYGFRFFRPLRPGAPTNNAALPELDHSKVDELRGQVDWLTEEIEQAKEGKDSLRAGIQSLMAAGMKMSMELLEASEKRLSERVEEIAADIQDIRRGCASLEEKIDKNGKRAQESLYAVFSRERMKELASEIERDSDDLYLRLKGGENYTAQDWDQWVNVHHHWERVLNKWIDTARWYAKDVKARILTVEDEEYDTGDWTVTDAQFPNADAVRRFKRHRIIQAHWATVRDEADQGAHRVAFVGLTEKEMHGGKYHQ